LGDGEQRIVSIPVRLGVLSGFLEKRGLGWEKKEQGPYQQGGTTFRGSEAVGSRRKKKGRRRESKPSERGRRRYRSLP